MVAEVDGWLHCVASNGSKGLVPASYVTLLRADQHAPPFRTTSPAFEVLRISLFTLQLFCDMDCSQWNSLERFIK